MSKHIQGPWVVGQTTRFGTEVHMEAEPQSTVSIIWNPEEDVQVDTARIVAAAPELLEALEAVLSERPKLCTMTRTLIDRALEKVGTKDTAVAGEVE